MFYNIKYIQMNDNTKEKHIIILGAYNKADARSHNG